MAVVSVAESAKVVGVEEVSLVALVRGDVEFGADDVIDLGRASAAAANDSELAERITAENKRDGASSPGGLVIESLESGVATNGVAIAGSSECAVVMLVSFAVR